MHHKIHEQPSEYEIEFAENRALEVFEYKNYKIYSYVPDIGFGLSYTLWYGNQDNEYFSSVPTLEAAYQKIDLVLSLKPEQVFKNK